MKKIIALLFSLIAIVLIFSGCAAKEQPKAWIDDIDALFVKTKRMNESEVHNLLGEPLAHVVDQRSDVYLDNQEVAVFIFYDEEEGTVIRIEREKSYETQETQLSAEKRCQIMNKLMGKSREQIVKRYGEFDKISKNSAVCRYRDFEEAKVIIYFNESGIAEKLSIKAKNEEANSSDENLSSKDETLDADMLLNDTQKLNETVVGMGLRDFLNIFGDPDGVMEEDNCRVYFDGDKNCVFFYFDELRKVNAIDRILVSDIENKDYYCLSDEQLLTALMNEMMGKTKKEISAEYGRTRYILTTPNAYGYTNLYGKRVNLYYDKDNVLDKIEINVETNDFADKDITEIRKKSIGLSPDDNKYFIDACRGYVNSKNCVVRLNSRGDAIVMYYNEGGNGIINRVEKLDGEAIKLHGAKNDIEKMVTILHHVSGKEKYQIEKEFGKADIKIEFSDDYMGYENIYGNKLMILYYTDIVMDKTTMVYVSMY